MKRREFLSLSTAVAAAAAVPVAIGTDAAGAKQLPGTGRVTRTPILCNVCFWRCAGFAYTEDGQPWKLEGHPEDLHSLGKLCVRGTGGLGMYLDEDRLKRPMLRVTEGGQQRFREVSWDEAFDFIAERMKKIADEHGDDRIALFQHGAGGTHFETLLSAYGSRATARPSFAQCRGPVAMGFNLTTGQDVGSPERIHLEGTKCIVLLGSHLGENMHSSQVNRWMNAVANGANLIVVDPRFSVAAGKANTWLPIKPGTDMALLLAWMHVIINEGLYDAQFVEAQTMGFEELSEHVQQYTPEWAEAETGLPAADIIRTARELGMAAPAAIIHPGRHVTWYGNDTQRTRAIASLIALLGAWGREGGTYQPNTVQLPAFPLPPFKEPKSNWRAETQARTFPMPGAGITNEFMNASVGPDAFFKGWFIYSTNLPITMPNYAHKLEEAAQNLDLVVVIDTMPADITGYADVILPECTYLERYDPLRNSPEREPSLGLSAPVFEPRWDSKPAWWMAKQIADRLDLGEYFPYDDYAEVLDWQLKEVGSSLEEMLEVGMKKFPRRGPLFPTGTEPLEWNTPSQKIEFFSGRLLNNGHDPMPTYHRVDMTPPDGFLNLNYGRAPMHTFGRTANNPHLFEMMPENVVWISPANAERFGVSNGEYVLLRNQDGVTSNRIRVRITERIGPDQVYIVHGFGHEDRRQGRAGGRGANSSQLMTRELIDPISGATGMRGNFVTLIREEASA